MCWLWFPRLFWQWHLWSWPCIPWQAGVVALFCPGWWLSNFSPCLQQALSLCVTTVGWGEKALMWEHPLLDLIPLLNHVKVLWRRGPKLRTIIKEFMLTATSICTKSTWSEWNLISTESTWPKGIGLIPQQSQQSLKSVLPVKYVKVKEITNHWDSRKHDNSLIYKSKQRYIYRQSQRDYKSLRQPQTW